MNVFDIIGPVMVGPSSSHTAGACRIGYFARAIAGCEVKKANITLSGSFARTYKGHGTDKAIVAGLLGFHIDDDRIRDSINIAKKMGCDFTFKCEDIELAHPNTAVIEMFLNNQTFKITGASIGGGNVLITDINGKSITVDGKSDVIIVAHKDTPGMISKITKVLSDYEININSISLNREVKHGEAIVVVQVDDAIGEEVIKKVNALENVVNCAHIKKIL